MTSTEVPVGRIRTMIVDDHSVIRCGLKAIFGTHRDIEVVAETGDAAEAPMIASQARCVVAVVDFRLAESSGLDIVRALKKQEPSCRSVILTGYATERDVRDAFDAGVHGYVMKSDEPSEIVLAVRAAYAGRRHFSATAAELLADSKYALRLTDREQQVLELLIPGNRNRAIASSLGVAEETVKGHVKQILVKLGVRDRTEAATTAIRRGLVRVD